MQREWIDCRYVQSIIYTPALRFQALLVDDTQEVRFERVVAG
jgi:hypothetical protein